MATIQGCVEFDSGLRRLGWVDADAAFDAIAISNRDGPAECWFQRWLACGVTNQLWLNSHGHKCVQQLVSAGWTLRSNWPRSWGGSVSKWLGERLFLGHASLFSETTHLHSLISSRIGRHGSGQPDWPQWIDAALRHVTQHQGHVFVAPGSTLAEMVGQFANTAGLPLTTACWTQHDDVRSWLVDVLTATTETVNQAHATRERLFLSPAFQPADPQFSEFPLQDRISIALADRVWSLSVRSGGTLEKLITARLDDLAFPTASVFVTLPRATKSRSPSSADGSRRKLGCTQRLSERGAVGWIVPPRSSYNERSWQHCHAIATAGATVQQLTGPFPQAWRELDADDMWPYLVHCTRGTTGPLLGESEASYRQRAWSQGEASVWHPLETLKHICHEGRLRGTASITRTTERCVSFSDVPIVPLLKRRTFRSHLGRWDWEPYGLLFRREALQSAQAREVIYGDESDFEQLDSRDKPFFQPYGRKGEPADQTWAQEREWRVLGDVTFHWLPADSVIVFVRTQMEAQQFARYSPWPVLWSAK